MSIHIETIHNHINVDCKSLKQLGEKALRSRLRPSWTVSVTFVDDSYIRELNNKYLKRDGPTDVLAFPIDDQESPQNGTDKILGDVYISLDRAKEQSIEYQVPFHQEVSRLMLHGLFHLLGYTHEEMSPLIERYLKVTDQTETE